MAVSCQAILLAVVLLALPSGNRMANRYLALFLAAEAIGLAGYTLFFSDIVVPIAFYFAPGFGVFAAPLLYLYVRALVDPNLQLGHVGWRVFAPLLPLYATAAVTVAVSTSLPAATLRSMTTCWTAVRQGRPGVAAVSTSRARTWPSTPRS